MHSLMTISQTSPAGLCKLTNCNSIEKAIDANTPTLGQLAKYVGDEKPLAFIEMNIALLAVFCNLSNSIKPEQAKMTAELILSEYPNLTIADVNYVFKKAKMGQYGDLYHRLDGQMILKWLGEYFEDRCNVYAERSIKEAQSYSFRSNDTPERINKLVKSIMKK